MIKFFQLHAAKIGFIVIFILGLGIGTWLSLNKPLWNDEIYTQERAIDKLSYKEILLVKFVEGNNSPIFYLMQKAVSDIAGFQLPMKWTGEWYLSDARSQVIMRIAPNVFMSLTVALVFYFFARYYSAGLGFYALLVTLSSVMVWTYWAEARPYALWIFLTTAQSLIFLRLMQTEGFPTRYFRGLTAVHLLLSFSVVLSMGQMGIMSAVIFLVKDRSLLAQRQWGSLLRRYGVLTVLPVTICCFYYFCMPSNIFRYCIINPVGLILAHIPLERIWIFGLYILSLILCFYPFQNDPAYKSLLKKTLHPNPNRDLCISGLSYLMMFLGMILFAVFILVYCKSREHPEQQTISLSDRYFMFLTPMEIIATIIFSCSMFQFFQKKKGILINVILILAGLLIVRYLRAAVLVLDFYN